MAKLPPLVLASGSVYRARLLERFGLPFEAEGVDIDETPLKQEKPVNYCRRIAYEKTIVAQKRWPKANIITADSIVYVGRKILQKPIDVTDAARMLRLQSGRRVHIITVMHFSTPKGKMVERINESWMKFKSFTEAEITKYVADPDNWQGVAGAMKGEKQTEFFVKTIHGSWSGIIGLPLYETRNLLKTAGYDV